jgi:hypothetical protein
MLVSRCAINHLMFIDSKQLKFVFLDIYFENFMLFLNTVDLFFELLSSAPRGNMYYTCCCCINHEASFISSRFS